MQSPSNASNSSSFSLHMERRSREFLLTMSCLPGNPNLFTSFMPHGMAYDGKFCAGRLKTRQSKAPIPWGSRYGPSSKRGAISAPTRHLKL